MQGDGGIPEPQSFNDLAALLSRLESLESSRHLRSSQIRERLHKTKDNLETIQKASADQFDSAAVYSELVQADSQLQRTEQEDRTTIFSYHRRLLAKLPHDLDSLRQISDVGAQVIAAKRKTPEMWNLPILSNAYSQWQWGAFDFWRKAEGGSKLREAKDAYDKQLTRFQDTGEWHQAASKLDASELNDLIDLLSTQLIHPNMVKDRQLLLNVAEDARAERLIPPQKLNNHIVAVSAVLYARRTGVIEAAALNYHIKYFDKLNREGTMKDIGDLNTLIASERRRTRRTGLISRLNFMRSIKPTSGGHLPVIT